MRPRPGTQGERPLNEVQFLTVAEAASILRVSKMAVYRMVHGGELPAIRVARTFRIPEQAVRQMSVTLHEQSDTA
ncbi:helix-turn-helix domain-containing protein [Streptomyces sp. NPDC004166]